MDKNTITGLLVIGLLLFGFSWYSSRQQKEAQRQRAVADSIYRATHPVNERPDTAFTGDAVQNNAAQNNANIPDLSATADSVLAGQIGRMLVEAKKGEEEFFVIRNDKSEITLSTLGGRVASVTLPGYNTYRGGPVVLFDAPGSKFDICFFLRNAYGEAPVNTGQYYFKAVPLAQNSLAMRLHVDSTAYIEYLYSLREDDYMVDFRINLVGMERLLSNQREVDILWEHISNQNEKGFENENNFTDLQFMYPGERSVEKLGISKGVKERQENHNIKWVAFKQQFFSSILVADEHFSGGFLRFETAQPGSGHIKAFSSRLGMPFDNTVSSYDLNFYFGPNRHSTLRSFDLGFERLIPLGWGIFGWINRLIVIPVFDTLSKHIASMGIIILLLTVFIKLLISPLTYKSYLSTAKMRLLKPEIDEIGARYPKQEDMAKKQQATMELYKRAGVSPMGGCIPMLIQFPILIAMFRFFPASIELRGQSFLWADDLSSYDSIFDLPFSIPFYGDHVSLFTLLMGLSMYFSARITNAQMVATPQMAGMKFMSLYLMPVMMIMWFNNYASGLAYYYFLSTLITIGQTYGFRYIVNDQKLHAKMKANAKKPKKKSKWAERYEQMLKEQQRQQSSKAKRK